VGLYTYPVLQAADVLLYKATHVPVGEDQKQHLELSRDTATKFNNDFGVELFPLPEPIMPPEALRVKSLRDGTAKMSKSDPSDQSRINLVDGADEIRNKVKRAKTDPEPLPSDVKGLEGRLEARNLVEIYATLSGRTMAAVLEEFGGQGFGQFKPALADLLVDKLAPMNDRYRELLADPAAIDRALEEGAEAARLVARETMREVRDAVGFL
jgi:tryptophanyl-tRNA synthetase